MQVLEVEGWQDVCEELSEMEFRKSWAEYQKSGPRTKAGKLYKPDAGAIYALAMGARPKVVIVADAVAEKPKAPPVTLERRIELMKEIGFSGDLKVRMRKPNDKPTKTEGTDK